MCQCIYCTEHFTGHKRRFVCKLCDGLPGETVTTSPNAEVSGPPPVTPESKQSATGGFAAPIC